MLLFFCKRGPRAVCKCRVIKNEKTIISFSILIHQKIHCLNPFHYETQKGDTISAKKPNSEKKIISWQSTGQDGSSFSFPSPRQQVFISSLGRGKGVVALQVEQRSGNVLAKATELDRSSITLSRRNSVPFVKKDANNCLISAHF